jgi:hypothetical protein
MGLCNEAWNQGLEPWSPDIGYWDFQRDLYLEIFHLSRVFHRETYTLIYFTYLKTRQGVTFISASPTPFLYIYNHLYERGVKIPITQHNKLVRIQGTNFNYTCLSIHAYKFRYPTIHYNSATQSIRNTYLFA